MVYIGLEKGIFPVFRGRVGNVPDWHVIVWVRIRIPVVFNVSHQHIVCAVAEIFLFHSLKFTVCTELYRNIFFVHCGSII